MPVNLWFPRHFSIFGVTAYSYHFFLGIGFLLFLFFFHREGGTVRWALILIASSLFTSWSVTWIFEGEAGMSFYGASLGVFLAGIFCHFSKKSSFLEIADRGTPGAAIGFAFMKMGCLLAGCCYGRPTGRFFYAIYERSPEGISPKAVRLEPLLENLPLVPTQLYVALLAFMIFLLDRSVRPWTSRKTGRRFSVALALYGTGRFGIDFLAGPSAGLSAGPLVWNQWVGLLMIGTSLLILVRR